MFALFLYALATIFQVNGKSVEIGEEATLEECREYDIGYTYYSEYTITVGISYIIFLSTDVTISKCYQKCDPTTETFNDGTSATYTSFVSIWCWGSGNAVCKCEPSFDGKTNIAVAWCKDRRRLLAAAVDDGDITARRRLQLTESDLTNAEWDCFQNEFCANMLIGYEISTLYDTVTSRRSICASSEGCSDETFALFDAAADDSDCTEPCLGINSFEYINDGVERTADEAQALCRDEYDSNLATIQDWEDLVIAMGLINGGSSPWIGLQSGLVPLQHHFRYIDGSDCPSECNGQETGECVCSSLWLNDASLPCAIGSKCTRIVTEAVRISNDKYCLRDTLSAVLCNCAGSAS